MRRTFLFVLPLLFVTLAGFGVWSLVARPNGAKHATRVDASVPSTGIAIARQGDTAFETWNMPTPIVEPERPPVAVRPAVEPQPDWSALRADIAVADANVAAMNLASAPAEVEIAMSTGERKALIASAKDPGMGPGPRGYRPGIAVIVAGGSSSGGVCR